MVAVRVAYRQRRQARYQALRDAYFAPWEARELSVLPKDLPALRLTVRERLVRRTRFEHLAAGKIARGQWRRADIQEKWVANLSRAYSRRGWRVKFGPTGDQPRMHKGQPNPWAMYRAYQRRAPGPRGYSSPWRKRPHHPVSVSPSMFRDLQRRKRRGMERLDSRRLPR